MRVRVSLDTSGCRSRSIPGARSSGEIASGSHEVRLGG